LEKIKQLLGIIFLGIQKILVCDRIANKSVNLSAYTVHVGAEDDIHQRPWELMVLGVDLNF
jgi:hypothetical protein